MEYYSAIKKNKRIPFAATWMQLVTLILREVSQKEKDMRNLKYGPKEPIYTTETHSRTERTDSWLPREREWHGPGAF